MQTGRLIRLSVAVCLIIICCRPQIAAAITLDLVKQRDELVCGVTSGLPGFANPDETGQWRGFHVEMCRAIAAAVLGDSGKVKFIALTEKNRLTALLSGKVDVLSGGAPWSLLLDTAMGVHLAAVTFYDGQGFLVKRRLGVKSALELGGATICLEKGSGTAAVLDGYFQEHGLQFTTIEHASLQLAVKGLADGGCQVLTADRTRLFGLARALEHADEYEVLPEVISRVPLGLVVRQGDDGWFNVIRWVFFGMLAAEEQGVSSITVETGVTGSEPGLIDRATSAGKGLGLPDQWLLRIIKQVGNYGEVFERSVGQQSDLKMDRGLNALWNRGGLQYAPPMR